MPFLRVLRLMHLRGGDGSKTKGNKEQCNFYNSIIYNLGYLDTCPGLQNFHQFDIEAFAEVRVQKIKVT